MDLKFNVRERADKGSDLHLRSPVDGAPLYDPETGEPVLIHLYGRDSQVYQRAMHEQQDRRIKRVFSGGRMNSGAIKAAAEESEVLDLLAACTGSWQHIDYGGSPLECTKANAHKLYADEPWIKEQVDQHIHDRSNVLGN